METNSYFPRYHNSYALIIGINEYKFVSNLGYAVNDAKEIAELLINDFSFSRDNVKLFLDSEASRQNIMDVFLSYCELAELNDRIVFFYAGHGHTMSGKRGEIGFLVPHEGNISQLSSLVSWSEITKNAELIDAKHMLFIMDACYGGLALTRTSPPGSMRFLKDMLLRYSRQVLTAGKANEVVSDSGGPLAGHSVFTGHLLEALKGKASSEEGIMTANGVMAYVYEKVARDKDSHQTPHYGFIDGDGDLIFRAPILNEPSREEEKDEDILISVPSTMPMTEAESLGELEKTKEYLSDSRYTIQLDDLVKQEVRQVLLQTSDDSFAVSGTKWSLEEFQRRLGAYEEIIKALQNIDCYIAYYGKLEHRSILKNSIIRLTDRLESVGGLMVWLALRWYPVMLMMYSIGIAALEADNYSILSTLFLAKVGSARKNDGAMPLALAIGDPIVELERAEIFKQLPGHERHYTARSEYLQPTLDDILFLGRDYESLFDRFEVLLALVHIDLDQQKSPSNYIWGPIGRFGWKYNHEHDNPLKELTLEAAMEKDTWGPISAGLFGGNYSRFKQISDSFSERIASLNWW